MSEFHVVAKVDRVVTSEIRISVEAENEQDAMDLATKALGEYPEPVTVPGVNRMMTTKVHQWIPKSIEFLTVRLNKKSA